MNYSIGLLTTREDCQAMIDFATADKSSLNYRATGLQRQRDSASLNSVGIDAELAAVTAEVTALQSLIDGLPEGSAKKDNLRKLKRSEYKKFLLEQRRENYGALSVLDKEYDIAHITVDIAETDAFIAAVTDKMNNL